MQERHVEDLIPAYALGILEPEEVDAVERHLESCPPCRALAESYRAVPTDLLYAVPQVAPPPSLRDRVLARIAEQVAPVPAETAAPLPTPRQRTGLARFLESLFGGSRDVEAGRLLRELIADPDSIVISLAGTEHAPESTARLVSAPRRHEAVLVTRGLRALDRAHQYQVWLLRGGQPRPSTVFRVGAGGEGIAVVPAQGLVTAFDTVAITPEPAGGSPGPTGPIVLAGAIA